MSDEQEQVSGVGCQVPEKKPVTGMDIHNLAQEYRARLGKFSKEQLLLSLSAHLALTKLTGHIYSMMPDIEGLEKELKQYAGASSAINRSKRIRSMLKRMDEGTWRPPKKRRKRKAKGNAKQETLTR